MTQTTTTKKNKKQTAEAPRQPARQPRKAVPPQADQPQNVQPQESES